MPQWDLVGLSKKQTLKAIGSTSYGKVCFLNIIMYHQRKYSAVDRILDLGSQGTWDWVEPPLLAVSHWSRPFTSASPFPPLLSLMDCDVPSQLHPCDPVTGMPFPWAFGGFPPSSSTPFNHVFLLPVLSTNSFKIIALKCEREFEL